MSRRTKSFLTWLVALMVSAILALGARAAAAQPVQLTCMDDDVNWLGACLEGGAGVSDCTARCQAVPDYGNPESEGDCYGAGWCCRCFH